MCRSHSITYTPNFAHFFGKHIQTRQEKKLHLARLGWDSNKAESDDEKLQKVIVSLYLYFTNIVHGIILYSPGHEIIAIHRIDQ